ncbi:MAG: hypothetical protein ACJAWS_003353 [Oleiphilaceae bacterium]|jgi:hypothetical protein
MKQFNSALQQLELLLSSPLISLFDAKSLKHALIFTLLITPTLSWANTQTLVEQLDKGLEIARSANLTGEASQQKVDKIQIKTDQLLDNYRRTNENINHLLVNNKHLQQVLDQQTQQTQSLNAQLEAVKVTEKAIIPLILNMIETLESSIESSLPFLLDERLTRIALLKALMIKPDTLIPEKYRRVLEAYEIEREFGYTLESYQEEIQLGESMKLVTMLRVGRIGLYYQTQNGNAIGFWNAVTDQWQSLSSNYREPIQQGILMASEQATPTLLRLPVTISGEKQ